MKDKNITIEYVLMKSREYNNDGTMTKNVTIGIKDILEKACTFDVKDRIWNYKDEVARMQLLKKTSSFQDNLRECKDLWELQFVRIRKDLLPGVATDDGSYDPKLLAQYLKDNQGIAESVSAIYDDELSIMVVQRNRDGVLISGIMDYLKNISKDSSITCDVIDLDIDMGKLKPSNLYRKLHIGLADLTPDTVINTKVKSLTNIINGVIGFGCTNTGLVLSIGRAGKNATLKSEISIQSALDLSKDPHVTKLVVSTKETANDTSEEIDLLERRLKDSFVLQYSKDMPITHDRVVIGLLSSYNKYRPILLKRLKR